MQSGGENSQYSFGDVDEGDLTTHAPSDAANSQALGNLDESADRSPISMEEFANTDAPIWRNVAYEDEETKSRIMQETHQSMVESGSVVVVPDSGGVAGVPLILFIAVATLISVLPSFFRR